MTFIWNTSVFINLVLCVVILILGVVGWRHSGKTLPLYVGLAFALFGVSHAVTLLGLAGRLEFPMIAVRTLGYLLVVFALYQTAFLAGSNKSLAVTET